MDVIVAGDLECDEHISGVYHVDYFEAVRSVSEVLRQFAVKGDSLMSYGCVRD